MIAEKINALLDELPRTRVGRLSREGPAFRACGIVGYYLALIVLLGGGLLAGRSLLVLAALALTCALSFYVYTYLRMWVTGHEQLVLLEHVWFALACCALVLWWMREPVLGYLDVVAVALCPFLAMGRVGCTLVGCCHGKPASIGIVYGEAAVRDGFPRYLSGVRLFPVPAIEAVGIVCIGVAGFIALPFARPGDVFVWYLLSYAVMRFGLEGLRGDKRPHLLGFSQARWMAVIDVALVLRLEADQWGTAEATRFAVLCVALILVVAWHWARDWRRSLLASAHVRSVRRLTIATLLHGSDRERPSMVPLPSPNLRVAVSPAGSAAHISLSLPSERDELPALCTLAAGAFPELDTEAAHYRPDRVLHLWVPGPLMEQPAADLRSDRIADSLYGSLVRRLQANNGNTRTAEPREAGEPQEPEHGTNGTNGIRSRTSSYFAAYGNGSTPHMPQRVDVAHGA